MLFKCRSRCLIALCRMSYHWLKIEVCVHRYTLDTFSSTVPSELAIVESLYRASSMIAATIISHTHLSKPFLYYFKVFTCLLNNGVLLETFNLASTVDGKLSRWLSWRENRFQEELQHTRTATRLIKLTMSLVLERMSTRRNEQCTH